MLKDYLSKLLALAMVFSFCAYSTAQNVSISGPASIAGDYPSIQAAFGPLADGQSGPVVIIDDGAGATTGCVAASNDLSGAVALIDRGACGFTAKALNAEAAGAVAVIVCNSLATFPDSIIVMGGSDGCALTIPAVMMSYGDCQTVRAEIGGATPVEATLPMNTPAAGEAVGAEIELLGAGTYTATELTGASIFSDSDLAQYYTITAPNDGVMNVNSCLGGADTRVWVLQGCRNVLAIVDTNDDACEVVAGGPEYASNLDVIVYAGEEYIIVWDNRWESTGFDFEVSFSDLPNVDVTVSVDMQDVTVDPAGAHIAGEFNGWTPEPMTDNLDGTYSFTFSTLAGYPVAYKFVNGTTVWEDNPDLVNCGVDDGAGNINRAVFPDLGGTTVGLVCFNSCAICPPDVACPNWIMDDFESYTLGGISAQSDDWAPWTPGSAGEDAAVTDVQANSGAQAMQITAADPDDQLLLLGNRTSGRFILKWKMYVPTGSGAYYNIQKNQDTPGVGDAFANEVVFNVDGTAGYNVGGAETIFNYPHDEWFEVYHDVDLDNDRNRVYVAGVSVADHPASWQAGSETGILQLGGIDFFGLSAVSTNYFVDDVLLKEIESCVADAIICDGFDGYDLGAPGPQAPWWNTWGMDPGGPDDGAVVNEAQLSCEQSLKISDTDPDDVLLLLGDRTNGNYELSWWMFVPSGSSAYYNTQKIEGTPGGEFGIQVTMDATGLGTLDAGAAAAATFNYPFDEWFQMSHVYNLDDQEASISINGTLIFEFNPSWTSFTMSGANQLGAVDFFGNTGNLYYVDDILFTGEEGMMAPTTAMTFQVDMSNETVAAGGVFMAGEMNGWTATAMTDMGGGIWAATYDIDPAVNPVVRWKFQNGNGGWEDSGLLEACGEDDGFGGFNRIEDVPADDITLPAVCFRNCVTCDLVSAEEAVLAASIAISPNPASSVVNVRYNFENATDLSIRLVNNQGQVISTSFVSSALAGNHEVNVSTLPTGIYSLIFTDGEATVAKRVMVN